VQGVSTESILIKRLYKKKGHGDEGFIGFLRLRVNGTGEAAKMNSIPMERRKGNKRL
jgi:hypothetical protein